LIDNKINISELSFLLKLKHETPSMKKHTLTEKKRPVAVALIPKEKLNLQNQLKWTSRKISSFKLPDVPCHVSLALEHMQSPINIFDFRKKRFVFANNKFCELIGMEASECYNRELKDYDHWIDAGDLAILQNEVAKKLDGIFNKYIKEKTDRLSYSVNFRLKEKGNYKEHIHVVSQCTVIEWNDQLLPNLTLNVLTDITHYRHNQKMTLTINLVDEQSGRWKNVSKDDFLRTPEMLCAREKEIMHLILLDKSATVISKEKNISFFTVRAHWRNILQKTNCKTQKELKHLAQVEGWV
jgi:DNA-binding CsgD family transcriptional regulator